MKFITRQYSKGHSSPNTLLLSEFHVLIQCGMLIAYEVFLSPSSAHTRTLV
jgi:hypothetical protein